MIAATHCSICKTNFTTTSSTWVQICPHVQIRVIPPTYGTGEIELKSEEETEEYDEDW